MLVSFDIDGTLEAGDPPGPVTFVFVAHFGCQRMLHIGGTALDEYYARLAGFEFRYAADLRAAPGSWLAP
jgi:hypothetical protein